MRACGGIGNRFGGRMTMVGVKVILVCGGGTLLDAGFIAVSVIFVVGFNTLIGVSLL